MADIIYSTYLEKNAVCGQLGLCGFKGLRSEATCGDCTDGVNGVASLLVGREKVFEMIELLQGEICQGNENCNYSVGDHAIRYAGNLWNPDAEGSHVLLQLLQWRSLLLNLTEKYNTPPKKKKKKKS